MQKKRALFRRLYRLWGLGVIQEPWPSFDLGTAEVLAGAADAEGVQEIPCDAGFHGVGERCDLFRQSLSL